MTSRHRILTIVAVLVGILCVAAAVVFKPWLIFVDTRVADSIPQVAVETPSGSTPAVPGGQAGATAPAAEAAAAPATIETIETAETAETAETPETAEAPEARQISAGTFISHEHPTSGSASIIEQADGTRVLAITSLDTTMGPDVHVWLSAADVVEGRDGWFTAGGADFLDLGPIKGNQGDQLYAIPDDADLSRYRAVDLWCVQFGVSFGAAQLL